MSVDKNFVVKNGLEVATNLFLVDKDAKSVGIASTGPRTKLDVRGGIACTDINVSGVATIATLDASDLGKINATSLNITGFSTLGGVSVDQLSVSGFTTFTDFSVDEISGRNLTITGIATVPVFVGLTSFNNGVTVAGISTIPSLDVTNLNATGLSTVTQIRNVGSVVSGVATIANANITTVQNYPDFTGGITVTGIVTATGGLYVGTAASIFANGNIASAGIITANGGFVGDITGNVTGDISGDLTGAASQITVADESSDTTCFPVFVTGATGNLPPKSGTNLTFNSSSGALTATSFVGALTGAVTGNADTATTSTNVTVADESSDTTCFPLFATAATGDLPPKSGSNLTFNSSSGALTATSFVGAVTGNVTGDSAGTHTGAVDLNGGVLTLDADADTTITADTDDQIDIAFGGNDRITLSTGLIDLKNDGSQSQVRLYCEVSNAHYAALQAPAHGDFSGNITLTLPATTDTLVGKTTTDTLTNKTLTSPSITSPSISSPSFTGDIDIADKIVHTGDTNTAIRFPAADTFSVETSGSEALRVDASGRLLLGTSSARTFVGAALNSHFQIEGTNDDTSIASIVRNSNNTGAPRFIFAKSRGTSDNAVTVVQDEDNLGSILFEGTDGTDTTTAAAIDCVVDDTPGNNNMPGRIVFSTQQPNDVLTERLRIGSDGKIRVSDGSQLAIGTGNDMLIHHNSLNSIINNGTGDLFLMTSGSGDDVNIQAVDDVSIKVQNGEQAIKCIGDGAVELYHDNSKKLETTSTGITVTGAIVKADGTSSQFLMADGSVTTATGSDVVDDTSPQLGGNLDVNGNSIVSASNGNISITPNGSGKVIIDGLSHPTADGNSGQVLKTDGSGNLAFASVNSLAGAGIQNVSDDSSPQLGGNLSTNGSNINFGDSSSGSDDRLKFGASNDLQIYHDGTDNRIEGSTADLYLDNVNGDDIFIRTNDDITIQVSGDENAIICKGDGSVDLYHNNIKKLETTSDGVTVTGDVNSTSDINLKKDIEVITNANELVKQLKGVTFTWKENDQKSVGVIAQDVEKILPQLVKGDEGEKSVNYSGIIGLLVEAVKELSARVEELEKTN